MTKGQFGLKVVQSVPRLSDLTSPPTLSNLHRSIPSCTREENILSVQDGKISHEMQERAVAADRGLARWETHVLKCVCARVLCAVCVFGVR